MGTHKPNKQLKNDPHKTTKYKKRSKKKGTRKPSPNQIIPTNRKYTKTITEVITTITKKTKKLIKTFETEIIDCNNITFP